MTTHSVIIRNEKYDGDCKFETSSFELSDFQKWAIDAFENGKNVLITAHTGSGKTYPAEHAIMKSVLMGKKIIYTSPIKSLSNQKFNDFQNKFKYASVGILTGDIKYNPEGNVLIMTTEILRNLVLYIHQNPIHHNCCLSLYNWKYSSYNSFFSDSPSKIERQEVVSWFGDLENFIHLHSIKNINFNQPNL